MNWDSIVEFIKLLNYITAGPGLLVVAILGLKQIKVSKDTARANSKRDAYRIAAEQCGHFANKIIPVHGKFIEDLNARGVKFFSKFEVNVERTSLGIKLKEAVSQKDLNKIYESEYLTDLLNSLEGYSMYFVSGVAAEQEGYTTTGKAYCTMVKGLIPLLFHKFKDGYYKNTYKLFMKWYNQNEDENLRKQKAEIEEKLGKDEKINIDIIGLEEKL